MKKIGLNWLRNLLATLLGRRQHSETTAAAANSKQIEADTLKEMVRGIISTRPDEIGCDECFQQLDGFVDMVLVGKDAAAAMPLVQDHLVRCPDCHEEFAALLAALDAMS